MKSQKFAVSIAIAVALTLGPNLSYAYAASSTAYSSQSLNGVGVRYVTVDMNNTNIQPVVLNAQNQLLASESLAGMAKRAGAVAAINGTYFEAYNGAPVPWGTIIKDGKVLHISNGGSVVGITSSGKLLIDRLTFGFEGYINGEYRAIPWRINHPSPEHGAITLFTPEYCAAVKVEPGAKGVLVGSNGRVTQIVANDFYVPSGGMAVVYNSDVSYLVDERYVVGDEFNYKVIIKTTFTNPDEWNDVVAGLGAGPSLIINGVVTAQGEPEGFTEAKINTSAAGRSFIGATADGRIVMGNMGAATLTKAAEICKSLGLVNAMCLDGGGSIALYCPAAGVSTAGRNINNGLAFIDTTYALAKPSASKVYVDGSGVDFTAYNINGSNYFKLRDLAMVLNGTEKQFNVDWSKESNSILLNAGQAYSAVGGELAGQTNQNTVTAAKAASKILVGEAIMASEAYNIGGSNYFKLRDIAELIDFGLAWDGAANSIKIDTGMHYQRQ